MSMHAQLRSLDLIRIVHWQLVRLRTRGLNAKASYCSTGNVELCWLPHLAAESYIRKVLPATAGVLE